MKTQHSQKKKKVYINKMISLDKMGNFKENVKWTKLSQQ